jgi:hypothetical protein
VGDYYLSFNDANFWNSFLKTSEFVEYLSESDYEIFVCVRHFTDSYRKKLAADQKPPTNICIRTYKICQRLLSIPRFSKRGIHLIGDRFKTDVFREMEFIFFKHRRSCHIYLTRTHYQPEIYVCVRHFTDSYRKKLATDQKLPTNISIRTYKICQRLLSIPRFSKRGIHSIGDRFKTDVFREMEYIFFKHRRSCHIYLTKTHHQHKNALKVGS